MNNTADTYEYVVNDGFKLHVIKISKFKSVHINVFFHQQLNDNATMNALLPQVMKRGCQGFRDGVQIERFLEDLYGADFDAGVLKKGEHQIIGFRLDMVDPMFTEDDNLLAKGFGFINDIISKPLVENKAFNEDYVTQEKKNLKDLINGLINDKRQYAIERCFQEMCKSEPFGRYVYGDVKDIPSIDGYKLFMRYEDIKTTAPVDVFVLGNVNPEQIQQLAANTFTWERGIIKAVPKAIIKKNIIQEKYVEENLDVLQGKLCLGFRTNTAPDDDDYPALIVYTDILGGGPHSKLFLNVREKGELAYYAFARLEKFKGLMIISSGIEVSSFQKALDIINQQLDDMRQGHITSQEIEFSKKSLTTLLNSIWDSPQQLIDYYLGNTLIGQTKDINSLIEDIWNVNHEDIVRIAQKVKLDTIYFLKNKKREVIKI